MPNFMVGDRVRLKASGAPNWIDRRLQLRAQRGTPGTVMNAVGLALAPYQRSYRIKFDTVDRMRSLSEIIPVGELEALP